ncbi:Holliday junction resolvase RuvX [Candidatus Saccharibacteria bacterium]|nr:Holliday junction resolvase RuvX [Candidatus Saccharibacteria bacterium]
MEILALDVGAAKVGMARGSSAARLAEPLKTVKTSEALAGVQELIKQNKVEAIVIGLPRNLSGEDTGQTRWVREWVKTAQKEIGLPFYFQDEALTSIKAKSYELRAKSSYDEHALAAAAILQDFLDAPPHQRIMC